MEAEMIMNNESELLKWPCDVPTVAEIDYARFGFFIINHYKEND
jgi:hypothetical protein